VQHPFSLDGKSIDPNNKKDARQFAIVDFQGTQHKITQGDAMLVDKIDGIDIGEKVVFDKVGFRHVLIYKLNCDVVCSSPTYDRCC
jgi:ribosomal protein L21